MDMVKELENIIRDGMREGIKAKMASQYNNPFEKAVQEVINGKSTEIKQLLDEAITSCLKEKQFRNDISQAVRSALAKTLVNKFGGELEKRVNDLKSDPTTRARITLAIYQAISSTTIPA